MTTNINMGGAEAQACELGAQIENPSNPPFNLATLIPVSADPQTETINVMPCVAILNLTIELLNSGVTRNPETEAHCRYAAYHLTQVVQTWQRLAHANAAPHISHLIHHPATLRGK